MHAPGKRRGEGRNSTMPKNGKSESGPSVSAQEALDFHAMVGHAMFGLEGTVVVPAQDFPAVRITAHRAADARGVLAVREIDNDRHASAEFWVEAVRNRVRA